MSRFSSQFVGRISLTLTLLGLVVATFILYVFAARRVDVANTQRQDSLLLAHELRQSSDDLTRMVRTYVVTGDPIYKEHFQEILDIRDGKTPRPLHYHQVYWDLVGPDNVRPRPYGEAVPLLELMEQSGFTDKEFVKLAEAKVKSDKLAQIEWDAMSLLERADPPNPRDRQQAIEMLHDVRYHEAKASIMEHIKSAITLVEARTEHAVHVAQQIAVLLRVLFVLFAVILGWQLFLLRRRETAILGGSVEQVHAEIAGLRGVGNNGVAEPVADGRGSILDEILRTKSRLAVLNAERNKTEASLRQSDDIIRNMQMGLYVYELENPEDDRSLRMVAANVASGSLTGVDHETITGRYIDEIFPALRAAGIPQKFVNIVRTGVSAEFENIDYKDDQMPEAAYMFKAFPLPQNRVGVTFDNITERKAAEVRLLELNLAVEQSGDGIALTDLDGNIRFVNRSWAEMHGYMAEELVGKNLDCLHTPEQMQAEVLPSIDRLMANGTDTLELEHIRKDGSAFLTHMTNSVIKDAFGRPFGLLSVARDITARKREEAERLAFETRLHQTQRLESLGVLAGGIAHDFNNILMAIMGHAELVLDDLSPLSPSRDSISAIVSASKRAAELCGQMLAYSGKGRFERCDMSLGDLVEETLHMLKTSISKKAILNLHLENALPCLHGDPAQIRQILMNLVINASDAIGERSGVITISTGAVEYSEEYLASSYIVPPAHVGTYVYFEVSDTGCGMDQKTISRIFEPFFTTKFAGRGLGMSAVMGIVKAHEGALRVYSEPNNGSTFKVLFPAIEAEAECAVKERDVDPWSGSGTVLLVDDEETIRVVGSKQLQRLGFHVRTASDGQEAVDIYREHGADIDLVIMDLTMPHMSGTEAYGALRQMDPDVRVVLASGYAEGDIAAKFAGKGLAGSLQKPYTLKALRKLLSTVLS